VRTNDTDPTTAPFTVTERTAVPGDPLAKRNDAVYEPAGTDNGHTIRSPTLSKNPTTPVPDHGCQFVSTNVPVNTPDSASTRTTVHDPGTDDVVVDDVEVVGVDDDVNVAVSVVAVVGRTEWVLAPPSDQPEKT
jgi:hypothetical protein